MGSDNSTAKHTPPYTQQEQAALEALRAHRRESGHKPWDHTDNDRLKIVDQQQKRHTQTQQAMQEGQRLVNQHRAASPVAECTTLTAALPQVTLAPRLEDEPPADALTTDDTAVVQRDSASPMLEVKVDPELGRVVIGLKKTGEFFIWTVAQHYFGQPGLTTRDTLYERVAATGVVNSRRHFNRLLRKGTGIFWGLDAYGNVYLRGYVNVSRQLTQIARDTAPDLVATNIPGARPVHLPTGTQIGQFTAYLYLGWLTYRQDPTIARDTLATLFGVTKNTLRNWEKLVEGCVQVIANYAQTSLHPLQDDHITDYIPAHSYSYVTKQGEIRIRWQQPNTYKTTGIREHAHKGQARKARTAAVLTAWYQPVEICEHPTSAFIEKVAFDRSHRVPKRYFEHPQQLQRFFKRLEKRGEPCTTPETPRYVFLDRNRHGHGIWELSLDGFTVTRADDRLSIKAEIMWWKGYLFHLKQPRRIA